MDLCENVMIFLFLNAHNTGQCVISFTGWQKSCYHGGTPVVQGLSNIDVKFSQAQDIWSIAHVPCPSFFYLI